MWARRSVGRTIQRDEKNGLKRILYLEKLSLINEKELGHSQRNTSIICYQPAMQETPRENSSEWDERKVHVDPVCDGSTKIFFWHEGAKAITVHSLETLLWILNLELFSH